MTVKKKDGTDFNYHLGSFSGAKLVGVKPQTDTDKAAACQGMANYITNEACQLERYTKHGWGPSNKNAQQNETIKADVALNALWLQNQYSTSQGLYPQEWWTLIGGMSASYRTASEHTYETAASLLSEYSKTLDSYIEA